MNERRGDRLLQQDSRSPFLRSDRLRAIASLSTARDGYGMDGIRWIGDGMARSSLKMGSEMSDEDGELGRLGFML